MKRLLVQLVFSPELRKEWPKKVLTAEAQLQPGGPWSIRAKLRAPPDQNGRAWALVEFLVPEAPTSDLILGSTFDMTLGSNNVASCTVRSITRVIDG